MPDGGRAASSPEDDGPVTVEQDATLCVPQHRPRQCLALDVSPRGNQLLGGEGVIDPHHLLLDDGAFVEVGGHVVGCGPDQLDTAFVRLVVGLAALEARQERVVDVDGSSFESPAEVFGQHLHVAREDHQVD